MKFSLSIALSMLVFQVLVANPFVEWKNYPKHLSAVEVFVQASRSRDAKRMESIAREAVKLYPNDGIWHYNLACALSLQNRGDEAIDMLAKAVSLGFSNANQIEKDRDLNPLRSDSRFQLLLSKIQLSHPPQISVNPLPLISKLPAPISSTNTLFSLGSGMLRSYFSSAAKTPLLYANRDDGHSIARVSQIPGLSALEWSQEAQDVGANIGYPNVQCINTLTKKPIPCLINCAMAIEHLVGWRSLPRNLLTSDLPQLPLQAKLFASGTMGFYPAHKDFTPAVDLLPANTPYYVISQGSSWSERPFLETALWTLASLPPQTRESLEQCGQLMPALQMILRQSKGVDYLSPDAHRSVFVTNSVSRARALSLAQKLQPDDYPGLSLEIIQDATPENSYFQSSLAIGRVSRAQKYWDKLTIRARTDGASRVIWRVLQAPEGKVAIKPLSNDGGLVELSVGWHGVFTNHWGQLTTRIDVAAFAQTPSGGYSCPAIVSFYDIPLEQRVYDANEVLRAIDYRYKGYSDPWFAPRRNWRDEYSYASSGALTGWTRDDGQKRVRYTAHGHKVIRCDRYGRATIATGVRYVSQVDAQGFSQLVLEDTGETYRYTYSGPKDFVGTPQKSAR